MMLLNCGPTSVAFHIHIVLALVRHIHSLDTLSATGIAKQEIVGQQRLKYKWVDKNFHTTCTDQGVWAPCTNEKVSAAVDFGIELVPKINQAMDEGPSKYMFCFIMISGKPETLYAWKVRKMFSQPHIFCEIYFQNAMTLFCILFKGETMNFIGWKYTYSLVLSATIKEV